MTTTRLKNTILRDLTETGPNAVSGLLCFPRIAGNGQMSRTYLQRASRVRAAVAELLAEGRIETCGVHGSEIQIRPA